MFARNKNQITIHLSIHRRWQLALAVVAHRPFISPRIVQLYFFSYPNCESVCRSRSFFGQLLFLSTKLNQALFSLQLSSPSPFLLLLLRLVSRRSIFVFLQPRDGMERNGMVAAIYTVADTRQYLPSQLAPNPINIRSFFSFFSESICVDEIGSQLMGGNGNCR